MASHFFQPSDLHDLKIVSKFLSLLNRNSSSIETLFTEICSILNAGLLDNFEKYSWKFITMLERFLSCHSSYAKALSPAVFIKLNLAPVQNNFNQDELIKRIIVMLKSAIATGGNYAYRNDIFVSLLPAIKACEANSRQLIFLEYYNSIDAIDYIATDEIIMIKKFLLLLQPKHQISFLKQLIENFNHRTLEKQIDTTKVLLAFLPVVTNELQCIIMNFMLDTIHRHDAITTEIYAGLSNNILFIPTSKLSQLADQLLGKIFERLNPPAYLLGKIAHRLSHGKLKNIITKIVDNRPNGHVDHASIISLSELQHLITDSDLKNAIDVCVMNFLNHSSYLLGNYKRWDHATEFVSPVYLKNKNLPIDDTHGATLVALNRLAIFMSDQTKKTVAAKIIAELDEDYFILRNNAYTFMGGLRHFIPDNQKLKFLTLLLDHPHTGRRGENGCEVIGLSVCQLISSMAPCLEVDEILEKILASRCYRVERIGYYNEISAFFAGATIDLRARYQTILQNYAQSFTERIHYISQLKTDDKQQLLKEFLTYVKENKIDSKTILDILITYKSDLQPDCNEIITDYITSIIAQPNLRCSEAIQAFSQPTTLSPILKKYLFNTLDWQNYASARVQAFIALGYFIKVLDKNEKILIYDQLKQLNLWCRCDIDPDDYPDPGLFFEADNFQLTKELILVFVQRLQGDIKNIKRSVILNNIILLIDRLPETTANYFVYGFLPQQYALAQHDLSKIELLQLINIFTAKTYTNIVVHYHLNQESNLTNLVTEYSGSRKYSNP